MNFKIILSFILCSFTPFSQLLAQSPDIPNKPNKITLTLDNTIALTHTNSISAMVVRNTFLSKFWSYNSFRAQRLPSLNLNAGLANFDRSLRSLQDAVSGEIRYIENFNLRNESSISINQNVAATGGRFSLYSSLLRLDQYAPSRRTTFYSQPVTLSYTQPLWSFNSLKWENKIEPQRYEAAKKEYLEGMEDLTLRAVRYFFDVASEQTNLELSRSNYANSQKMMEIAKERFDMGAMTRNDLLQLEIRLLNDSLSIKSNELQLISQKQGLASFLGFNEEVDIEIVVDTNIPQLQLEYYEVLDKVMKNSSFMLLRRIEELEAERNVAQSKANKGISAEIRTQFGLSNSNETFQRAYRDLADQEIFGLTLSVPILDWGVSGGRVKMAQAQAQTVRNQIEQAISDYRQEIFTEVMKFNYQYSQVGISRRAKELAEERYELSLENFADRAISITDLNLSQSEKDQGQRQFLTELQSFWTYYYQLRRKSLFDYISGYDISAEFDNLTK